MPDIITRATALSALRLADARARCPEAEIRARALEEPPPPTLALDERFDLLAEIKLASPSAGALTVGTAGSGALAGTEIAEFLASSYQRAGAAAISVLTEPEFFGGSLDHLVAAARVTTVPVLRKDFLVDPYQVFEARAAGAGGVLLILRSTGDPVLAEMLDAAAEAGLFVLLEAFDAGELDRAGKLLAGREGQQPQILVGVNTRNLETLEVDRARLATLAPRMPQAFPGVAESGLDRPADAAAAAALGYRLALVGSALVRSPDPEALLAAMLRAGRAEASS